MKEVLPPRKKYLIFLWNNVLRGILNRRHILRTLAGTEKSSPWRGKVNNPPTIISKISDFETKILASPWINFKNFFFLETAGTLYCDPF